MELSNQEVKLSDNTRVLRENNVLDSSREPEGVELAVNAFMAQFGLMLRIDLSVCDPKELLTGKVSRIIHSFDFDKVILFTEYPV